MSKMLQKKIGGDMLLFNVLFQKSKDFERKFVKDDLAGQFILKF